MNSSSAFHIFGPARAVLAEACARLASYGKDQSKALDLLVQGSIKLDFDAGPAVERLAHLMKKNLKRPIDFADACAVEMTEEAPDSFVGTMEGDAFSVYPRHERLVAAHISPSGRHPS